LLCLLLCGCAASRTNGLLSIWPSTAASAQQKVDAINKFIAAGTDGEQVKSLLGDVPWNRYHGSTIEADGKRGLSYDYRTLEYPAGGSRYITLQFESESDFGVFRAGFDHAYLAERILLNPYFSK